MEAEGLRPDIERPAEAWLHRGREVILNLSGFTIKHHVNFLTSYTYRDTNLSLTHII